MIKNNSYRRAIRDRKRRQIKQVPKKDEPPFTIGMIFRLAFMIITAGIFSGK